jgi:Predicted nucleotide-binding protein containing TIR-like domain
MAQVPIEIMTAGDIPSDLLEMAIGAANTLQADFRYTLVPEEELTDFRPHAYGRVKADEMMDYMAGIRAKYRGYRPYLLAFIDAHLDGRDLGNIFGSDRAEEGLAVFTIANVADLILPRSKLSAYFLYYMAKASFSFFAPGHKNHSDTRGCVYDRKEYKRDLVHSMRARAICDLCRRSLLERPTLSPRQFTSLERLFSACGDLLREDPAEKAHVDARPSVFVGSSVEGLIVARKLKSLLLSELAVEAWDEGTVFGLGDATLESLEKAVHAYQFGIFVFTPDDSLNSRGEIRPVARDNVLFELGLFIGKLSRKRAFVIRPSGNHVTLASDLAGITMAQYDSSQADLSVSLQPACEAIRRSVRRAMSG